MIKDKLTKKIEETSGAKKEIIKYLLNCEDYYDLTASKVAKKCFVSNSYITKFCKEMGYNKFDNMRLDLIRCSEFNQSTYNDTENFEISQYANEVLNTLINTTNTLEERDLTKIVNYLTNSDLILLYGIGSSSIPCEDLYYKIMKLNYNVKYEKDESIRKMISEKATENSVGIIFSYSGPSEDVQSCINTLKKRNAKVILISMSDEVFNEDIRIRLYACEDFNRSYSIYSRISMSYISDLIYIYLRKETISPER